MAQTKNYGLYVVAETEDPPVRDWVKNISGASSSNMTIIDEALNEIASKVENSATALDTDLNAKMDKSNPIGTGSFSLNRDTARPIGDYSVAVGYKTVAMGQASHAEGEMTLAIGDYSHAQGYDTIATADFQNVIGKYNIVEEDKYIFVKDEKAVELASHTPMQIVDMFTIDDTGIVNLRLSSSASAYMIADIWWQGMLVYYQDCVYEILSVTNNIMKSTVSFIWKEHIVVDTTTGIGAYAHIIGNGSSSGRSNAHTVDWDGNAWFAGNVYVNSTSGTNRDDGSKKLATIDDTKSFYATYGVTTFKEIDDAIQNGRHCFCICRDGIRNHYASLTIADGSPMYYEFSTVQGSELVKYCVHTNDVWTTVFGDSPIFIAVYGKTTYNEVSNAWSDGKPCFLSYGGTVTIPLTYYSGGSFHFAGVGYEYLYESGSTGLSYARSFDLYRDNTWSTTVKNFLSSDGGIMKGFLKLHANPEEDNDAATKYYVDSVVSTIDTYSREEIDALIAAAWANVALAEEASF